MAREAQGWRHFHQEGYKGKRFAASSAVTGFASSAFGGGFVLGFVCLWCFCSFPEGDEVSAPKFCI